MSHAHLRAKRCWGRFKDRYSEFSSWGSSIILALAYAARLKVGSHTDICIAILDTSNVCNTLAACNAFTDPAHDLRYETVYDHEWFVHGIVSGEGALKVVRYEDILASGLLQRFPEFAIRGDFWGNEIRQALFRTSTSGGDGITAINQRDVKFAQTIGILFGSPFALPVMAAILSLRPRSWQHGPENMDPNDLKLLLAGIVEYPVPQDWCQEQSLFRERLVNPASYQDVTQMYILLRIVVNKSFGRGVRRVRLERGMMKADPVNRSQQPDK